MTGYLIQRDVLNKVFDGDKRAIASFEQQQRALADLDGAVTANVAATAALTDASFVTLSPNTDLTNEYVMAFGRGMTFNTDTPGQLILATDGPNVNGGFSVQFTVAGNSTLALPLTGIVATRENTETLKSKTLDAPSISGIGNYANDAAAAAAGVPVGGVYRIVNALQIRLV